MESVILRALQDATKAAVAQCDDPTLPIKFIDGKWSQPDGITYIEIVRIENNPDDVTWGNDKQYRGLYRMLLHWSIQAQGAYKPLQLAESIARYFVKGRWFGSVKITDVPNVSGPIESAPDTMYAVGVRYEAFQPDDT